MIPVLSPEQSAGWDAQAESAGIALATLMETAGRATAAVIAERYRTELRHGVLVAAGPGHHGGGGGAHRPGAARPGGARVGCRDTGRRLAAASADGRARPRRWRS